MRAIVAGLLAAAFSAGGDGGRSPDFPGAIAHAVCGSLAVYARQPWLEGTYLASIDQYTCITANTYAGLIPNSSIPLTASRAPIICQGRCSVSPDAPRVDIASTEESKASMGESRAPSHKYAAAQIPHSIPCGTANSSPITPHTNLDRDQIPQIKATGFQSGP